VGWKIRGLYLDRSKIIFVQNSSFLFNGNQGIFQEVKRPEREADLSSPLVLRLTMSGGVILLPIHAFITHTGKFLPFPPLYYVWRTD